MDFIVNGGKEKIDFVWFSLLIFYENRINWMEAGGSFDSYFKFWRVSERLSLQLRVAHSKVGTTTIETSKNQPEQNEFSNKN